jgi:hypothetical protein
MDKLQTLTRALILIMLNLLANGRGLKEAGGSSGFSFADALGHDTGSIIVVPGNHSVAKEFDSYLQSPVQLSR